MPESSSFALSSDLAGTSQRGKKKKKSRSQIQPDRCPPRSRLVSGHLTARSRAPEGSNRAPALRLHPLVHPQAVLAAGGALPGPPPPACPAAPRHGGCAAPASISPLSVPTSFLSLCPCSVHVLSFPPPCPRGFSLGSPGSASSALVPSPNLPGCAGRGVLAAAEGEPAACAAPPQPQNNACRCQGDPNIFGGGLRKP